MAMKKQLLCAGVFAIIGYAVSCFQAKYGGVLPALDPSMDNLFIFLSPLAIPYAVIGSICGALVFSLTGIVREWFSRC